MTCDPVRLPAAADTLPEGAAARFALVLDGVRREAFALRWRGRTQAWVNACRHQSLPLDSGDGHVLDAAAGELVCAHHGARYRPDTGECVSGPCRGAFLTALSLERRGNELWCTGRSPQRPDRGEA